MSTSYDNTGGTGDRTGIITTSSNIPWGPGANNETKLINGVKANGELYFNDHGHPVLGKYMKFDFGHPVLIDEVKWIQESVLSEGVWGFDGSLDDSTWVEVCSYLNIGVTATSIWPFSNRKMYRYYRLIGKASVYYYNPWLYEIEFKISDDPAYKEYLINRRDRIRRVGVSLGMV